MRTGIIVARFQTSYLHDAHHKLIQYVMERNERVIIFLGTTTTRLTINNPLDYKSRARMIQEQYNTPNVTIAPLPDMKLDEEWSKQLDAKIFHLCNKEDEVTLYASRGGFIETYGGEHKTEFIESIIIEGISATDIRNAIHSTPIYTKDWREGVIWASAHKYPVSYQTVDVAIIDNERGKVLLGKKKNENGYRFCGGYVDATGGENDEGDLSLEDASKRECMEEIKGIETDEYKYICSARINDWRYRKSKDKIMTAFFACNYIFGKAEARRSEDLESVEWFSISNLTEHIFEPEHIILFKNLMQYLEKRDNIKIIKKKNNGTKNV